MGEPRTDAVAAAVGGLIGTLTRRDTLVTPTSARLMVRTSPLDHSKATRELGWKPEPATEAIARTARFFLERHRRRAS